MAAKDFLPKIQPVPTLPAPRKSINLLPGYLQTSALSKFFGITLDQLIQPAQQESVAGYIGEKGGLYYNPSEDFYLNEATPDRNNYQLEPTAVSIDNNNNINFVEFYQDIVNNLEFDGSLVNNHSRLFAEEYYSWCPPINPDMFVNFTNYFWVEIGPQVNVITAPTNAVLNIIGQSSYSITTCIGTVLNPTFAIGDVLIINDISTTLTGTTLAQTIIDLNNNSALTALTISATNYNDYLQIAISGSSTLTISGNAATTAGLTTSNTLSLSSGMEIQFTNDANTEYNNISFIVEGVGSSIMLINDSYYATSGGYDILPYDSSPYDSVLAVGTPDYWTIRRGSQDGNPWSRTNRWFHKNVLGTLNLGETSFIQATRPIIEFLPNLELRNFARYARPDVNILSTTDSILDIIGQSSYTIDGIQLEDGQRILITGDPNASSNNKIYVVFGLNAYGKIGLQVEVDGLDSTGLPVTGEGVYISSGSTYYQEFFYYNGTSWVAGQQKTESNQPPIYNLYDINSVRLDNAVEYPNSTFNGSQIFSYTPNGTVIDPILGIDLTFDTFGDIGFTDFLTSETYTYTSNNVTTNITGYYFYRQFNSFEDIGTDSYLNDWHKSSTNSRQLVKDEFVITQEVDNLNEIEYPLYYTLSIVPDANNVNLPVNSRAFLNGLVLVPNVDYNINGNTLELSETLSLANDDVLEVETWAQTIPELLSNGYFEIPSNLSSNPNNEQITQASFNQISPQLISIIQNQTGLTGNPNGINNYYNTARDLSRGSLLLNHTASMLRVALLTGNANTKLTDSIRYNNQEYTAFINKFLIKLQQFINQGYTSADLTSTWITDALYQINLGKTPSFPFAYSAMTSGNNYIPSTAAALGVTPVYYPTAYTDYTRVTPKAVIQGHDGSIYSAYGDYRDDVILALEMDFYNNIDPSYINPDRVLEFDSLTVIPGYFRTTDYSRSEWLQLSQPAFERYVVSQRLDYVINTTFDQANNLTWNYSSVTMPNGQLAPGHWRGIFQYFYDTIRPHTNPWEMLGFGQQPSWWESEYGPAPYTNQNLYMWQDLASGTIRQGARAGTYSYLARTGLLDLIPVDQQGNLLDPITIGLVTSSPNVISAANNWVYGDIGPVEFKWRTSPSYPYDLAESMYLAKPAKFVDIFWEARKLARDQGQLYDINFGRRFTSADLTVHNEVLTDGSLAVVRGISNWISDYLASLNLNIASNFGDLERELNVELAYRAGSFIKADTLSLNSDSFGLVPTENTHIMLYKGASVNQPIYSGVIIIWDGSTYRVSGYDSIGQKFTIIPGEETGQRTTVNVNGIVVNRLMQNSSQTQDVVYYSSLPSRQAVYNFLTGYQAWLESEGWVFADYDTVNNLPNDFTTAGSSFLQWSSNPLKAGDTIILSPASSHLVFNVKQGHVENLGQFVNGVYGIIDRTGYGINSNQFQVSRNSGTFEVTLNSDSVQGIYCLRLSLVEYEHIVILDNTTDFGNLVYDPILGIRQPRFQLFANRTMFWNGEPLAAGFIVQDGDLIDNFETSVDNFRRFYDFDLNPATGIENQLAEHTIGYQDRTYMLNLLLDNSVAFDYYKGFIGSKGTLPSFNNILRSSYITKTAGFTILEEWAFQIGEYGNTEKKSTFEIQIRPNDFSSNPQLIEFLSGQSIPNPNPSWIQMLPNDSRWVLPNQTNTSINQFALRDFKNKNGKDLPNAGYVQLNETTYNVLNTSALTNTSNGLFTTVLYGNTASSGSGSGSGTIVGQFNDGDTIWQILLDNGGWTVYRVCLDAQIYSIESGVNPSDPTVFTLVPSSQTDINPNDILFLQTTTSTSGELMGVQTVLNTSQSGTGLAENQFSISTAIDTGILYPTVAIGTVNNPVFAINDTITINGIVTTLTGTGLTQTIADINAALLNANSETTITASATQSNALQISDSSANPITIDLTAGSTNAAIIAGMPAESSYTGPFVYVLKPVRFLTPDAFNSFTPYNGWLQNDLVWIDNNGINLWEVMQYSGTPILGTVANPTFNVGDTLTINNNTVTFGPISVIGTIINPSFGSGDTLTINSTPVTITGTSLAQIVDDINNTGIENVTAYSNSGFLELYFTGNGYLSISGTVQTKAGLPLAAYVSLTQAIGEINTAINGITASNSNGQLLITTNLNPNISISGSAQSKAGLASSNTVGWSVIRTENDKINISQVYTAYIYNSVTNQDVIEVQLYDPFKGLIFASADAELYYQTDYDPAKYNVTEYGTDSALVQYGALSSQAPIQADQAWGDAQVGRLWWDLSTTRYLDYEQGTYDYRKKNWGQLAPGVVPAVYEWVKSPVAPSGWDAYVLAQETSGDNRPTGTLPLEGDTPYVTINQYNPATNSNTTYYYFWVLTPNTIPDGLAFRNLDALSVQSLIMNNNSQNIAWMAPIAQNAFIINGVEIFINDVNSVLQVVFFQDAEDSIIHKQWILGREADEINPPYIGLWNKMTDSLVGYDLTGLTVPDPTLPAVLQQGNQIRPRQSWFVNRLEARLEFFEKVNEILLATNITSESGWEDGLTASDPYPNSSSYNYVVATRAARNLLDNTIAVNKTVLVQSDEDLNGYWTLWTYNGGTSWTLINQQSYRATDYWTYADWYASGYSSSTVPNITFATVADMNANISLFTDGEVILVQNNGANEWQLYVYELVNSLPQLSVVGQQSGTIQFLQTALSSYDTTNQSLDIAISTVTRTFVDALLNNLLTVLQQNTIFFTMIHYVHFEQTIVPWAFKTSMVYGLGQIIPFNTDYILPSDETDDLTSFFDEAKPYHTKLRTLTEQRRTQIDEADVEATDSDLIKISMIYDRVSGNTPFKGTIIDGEAFYQYGAVLSSGYDKQPYDEPVLGGYDFDDTNIIGTATFTDPNVAILTNPSNFGINGILVPMTGTSLTSTINDINTISFVLGNIQNPVFNNGVAIDFITINGTKVVLTGTDVNQTVIDINNAAIANISAVNNGNNQLEIYSSIGANFSVVGRGAVKAGIISNSKQLINLGIIASSVSISTPPTAVESMQITNQGNVDIYFSGVAISTFGFPAIALYNQMTPSTLENYYDIFVNGGNPLDQAPSITEPTRTDSSINIDGNQLIQPYLESNHPEELIPSRVGDAVIIDVYTYDTPTSSFGYDSAGYDTGGYDQDASDIALNNLRYPKHRVKRYFGTIAGSTGPFTIGQNPQNKQALFVQLNGELLKINTNYTVDWNTATVTMNNPIFDTDILVISSFSAGGGAIIKKKVITNTSLTSFDMKVTIPNSDNVLVTVDGNIANFTVSGTVVTITNPLPNNSCVLIIIFDNSNYSTIVTQTQASNVNGTYNFNVARPDGSIIPDYLTTDVFKNGIRLSPPPLKVYTRDSTTTTFDLPITAINPNDINVWLNGNLLVQSSSIIIGTVINPTFEIGEIIIINGVTVTLTGTTLAQTIIDIGLELIPNIVAQNQNGALQLSNTANEDVVVSGSGAVSAGLTTDYSATTTQITLVGTPIQGEVISVQVNEGGDYTISGNETVIIPNTIINDVIQVTTYTEDQSFQMYTESYLGVSNNQYALGVKPYDMDSIIVYKNGNLLTVGKDYILTNSTDSFNNENDINFTVDFNAAQNIVVQLSGQTNITSDKIVITYYTQLPSQDPIAFRMFKNIFGKYEYLRISDQNSTWLTAPLLSIDQIVTVNDATVLGQPDIAAQSPGVVFINGERITFWNVDTSTPGQHQLLQCMRGTSGTGINIDLEVNTVVRDASKNQIIPGNSWNWVYTPEGLLYSNDPQALFLQQASGSQTFSN